MHRLLTLFALLTGFSLLFPACNSCGDPELVVTNEITIEVFLPAEGEVISMAASNSKIDLKVQAQAEVELHQITMSIYPEGDESNPIWENEGHGDGNELWEYGGEVALSNFNTMGNFVLQVTACGEHMCQGSNIVTVLRNFEITP